MKIATWNINGLRARLSVVQRWLDARQPDIVGLQELKLADNAFPVEVFVESGYHAVFHGQKSWNGVAILSKTPLVMTRRELPGQTPFGARLITATIGDLSFTTVYCPNGKALDHADYERKLAWFDSLIGLLEDECDREQPLILCGDFNVVPAAIDSWNETRFKDDIFHTEAERHRLQRILDWGLVDLFRQQHQTVQAFSWWDYRAGAFHRNHGLRIDLLLGTPPVAARLRHIEIDREYRKKQAGLTASDHAPVVADLE